MIGGEVAYYSPHCPDILGMLSYAGPLARAYEVIEYDLENLMIMRLWQRKNIDLMSKDSNPGLLLYQLLICALNQVRLDLVMFHCLYIERLQIQSAYI